MTPTVTTERVTQRMQTVAAREDRLGRFSPTPLAAALCVMGRTLTLETNSATVLRQARCAFEPYGFGSFEQSEFLWRIVSETHEPAPEAWPEANAVASGSLRLAHFDRRSFFAVDLEAREAVGRLPETLVADESGFCGIFLAALFQSTASALRLTQISAACLALKGKGLLLFGPSQQGKSAVSRLAARLGLEFHSDQATFIETEKNGIKAWCQCWPAHPQPDTPKSNSEIPAASRLVKGEGGVLVAMEQHALRPVSTRSVAPVLCIFLEPVSSEVPRLSPVHGRESWRRLQEEGMAGVADPGSRERDAVARALSSLPAYRLAYGRDPGVAAVFLHSMLKAHNLLEAQS